MNVSVCIPTYNQAPYLEQAIRSAAGQSLAPVEIIVSDDASTDETPAILHRLKAELPQLHVIRQRVNLGLCRNADQCLRAATGDFVLRLDSDDLLHPTYVQTLLQALLQHPDAGYAHAAVHEIDQHGAFLRPRQLFRKPGFQPGDDALRAAVKGYRVAANILLFRRRALAQVNYLTGRPNYAEDYHITTAIAAAGFGNVYVNEPLASYRVWVDAGRVRQRRKLDELTGVRRVFDELLQPAFQQRGWSLAPLNRSRASLASLHADCVSWPVYTDAEQEELADALRALSPTRRTNVLIWLHQHGFNALLARWAHLKATSRFTAKLWLLRLKA